jgi:outer membrane protein assembly factor BamD (BamD/ComL family)
MSEWAAEYWYNEGIKKMEAQDFKGAEGCFMSAYNSANGDDRKEFPNADEIEYLAHINCGIARFNQGKDFMTIINCRYVLDHDDDPERRDKANELYNKCS